MRWWSISAATNDLSIGALDSRALLPYVLALGLLETAAIEFSFLAPASEELGLSQTLLACLTIAITAFGILYVYRVNGGAKGAQFLERLLVLGWVVGIRYSAFMFVLLLLFGALSFVSDTTSQLFETLLNPFFSLALLLYYLYLGHHVARIAKSSRTFPVA